MCFNSQSVFLYVSIILYRYTDTDNKFKKPKQNLIDVPPSANFNNANTKMKLKGYIFEMYLKISITHASTHARTHTHIYIYMQ